MDVGAVQNVSDININIDGSIYPVDQTSTITPTGVVLNLSFPALPLGSHTLNVDVTSSNGSSSLTFNSTVLSVIPVSGLTITTPFGTVSQGSVSELPPIAYADVIDSGVEFSLSADSLYNVTVYVSWGDNTSETAMLPAVIKHNYTTGGQYNISLLAVTWLG